MPCSVSQTGRPLPTSALWRRLWKTASGSIESGASVRTWPLASENTPLVLDMEDLHDRDAAALRAVDESLHAVKKRRRVGVDSSSGDGGTIPARR